MRIFSLLALLVQVLCEGVICYSLDLFPNVSLQGTRAPEQTQPSNLFIYEWPVEEQATNPGTITALEYCYQRTDATRLQVEPIFTLIMLKPVSGGYRVTHKIEIAHLQDSASCTNREGIVTCCERQRLSGLLRQTSPLTVPSESTAFGIFARGRDVILGYRAGQERNTTGYQIAIQAVDSQTGGLIQVPQSGGLIQYRMFNFVIDTLNQGTTTKITSTEATGKETTIKDSADNYKTNPATSSSVPNGIVPSEEDQFPSSLYTIKWVTIIVGCIVVLIFLTFLALSIYMCYKARQVRKEKERDLQVQLPQSIKIIPSEISQPIYEYIDTNAVTAPGSELPKVFTRNPSYACRRMQTFKSEFIINKTVTLPKAK